MAIRSRTSRPSATARPSTVFSPPAVASARRASWASTRRAVDRARDLVRHAAALLHVRRAADGARLLGVRGRAARHGSGSACARLVDSRGHRARGRRGARRDGSRTGCAAGVWSRARCCPVGARDSDAQHRSALRHSRRWSRARSQRLGAFGVVYMPQALAYISLNGHLGPSRLVTRKMTWTAPHAFQVLFSPEHGFLVWTPLAILAIIGLALHGPPRHVQIASPIVPTSAESARA